MQKYTTKISDRKWWAYDIPGNIGWILYIIMTIISISKHPKLFVTILAAFPAVFMLIGVVELIRERVKKLDRVLSKWNLIFGFGTLTLGGLLGFLFSLAGAIHHFSGCHILAAVGGLLCFVFAGLLLKGYKKNENEK